MNVCLFIFSIKDASCRQYDLGIVNNQMYGQDQVGERVRCSSCKKIRTCHEGVHHTPSNAQDCAHN